MTPISFAPVVQYPVITFAVLLTLSNLFMTKLDYLWAGLCLMGAVYFIFRG